MSQKDNSRMSWYTFAGEYSELFEALVKEWCISNDIPTDSDTMAKYFKLHLERGTAYLSGTNFIKELNFIPKNIETQSIEDAEIILAVGRGIKTKGIQETAKTWLQRHWEQLNPKPLDEGGWEIMIPGDTSSIKISDPRKGIKNEEILNII